MSPFASILLIALTRAELLERFRAPVLTQADGLVKVYAGCPEDLRREYQAPVARFAGDLVRKLYQGLAKRPVRFEQPGIVLHLGDVRTNLSEVAVSVATNGARVLTRIRLRSPGYADLDSLRLAIVKGFYRSVERRELSDAEAVAAFRRTDPVLRVRDERQKLEDWLSGCGTTNVEEGLALMRRVFAPGKASRRDVLIFASRLYLYPPQRDVRLAGRYESLSFREAVRLARTDLLTRLLACRKAEELPVLGGGRGDALTAAAEAYRLFLLSFAAGKDEAELEQLLDDADTKLNLAFEKAEKL